jgi:hypothetical protein
MAQAYETRTRLCAAHGWPESMVELVPVTASGDKILDRPLAEIGGKALWTKELDAWLFTGEIDFAVHSMKDVETVRPEEFVIAAVLPRADGRFPLRHPRLLARTHPGAESRDAGHGVRQGFHRAGSLILEIVERPDLAPETPAEIWGVVFVVEDLDATVTWLGPDAVGATRDAVQNGRRIASVKKEVGLGLPVALMSPHVH